VKVAKHDELRRPRKRALRLSCFGREPLAQIEHKHRQKHLSAWHNKGHSALHETVALKRRHGWQDESYVPARSLRDSAVVLVEPGRRATLCPIP
jgi:hypothetical protein